MLGRTLQELEWDPSYTEEFYGMLRQALTTGRLIEDAHAVSTPGGVMHHEYALAPLRGQHGDIEGGGGDRADVTPRVAAESERRAALETAQQAVRQRDDVLAVVSHDLRNMLNVFRLTGESLRTELPDDAGVARDFVARLERQATR